MRGFLSGLIWGLVLMVGGVAILSLISPVGPRPDVEFDAPDSAAVAPENPTASGIDAANPDADLVEAAPAAPGQAEDQADDLTPLNDADTSPGSEPDVGDTTDDLNRPTDVPTASGVDVAGDSPVAGTGEVPAAPTAPDTDVTAQVPAETLAQPAAPIVSDTDTGLGGTVPSEDASPDLAGQIDPAPKTEPGTPISEPAADSVPDPSTTPAAAPQPTAETAPAPQVVTEIAPVPAPELDVSTAVASDPEPAPLPELDLTPDSETVPDAEVGAEQREPPQIAVLPQAGEATGDGGPTIGRRVVPLTQRNQNTDAVVIENDVAIQSDAPPLTRYAAPFNNPEGKPIMAIVLIDDAQSFGSEALATFPYPLTFAVNPNAPDAAEKMAAHRAAGFEVLALIDLPAQGTAQDAEVALAASFDNLSEAVGLLEGTQTGIQGNRGLSDQVSAFVGSTGRGMITQSNGLNTVQKLAVRNGVPAAVVFRDFDGAGQTPTVMRRFLDQAAFRAGQEGGVIMMGRVRPGTISALLLWGLQDRASRVMLAPVSAVLRGNTAQ